MPQPAWPKVKEGYDVHERASKDDWDESKARRLSSWKAQYNPHLLNRKAIELLELHCIEHGILLSEKPKENRYYLDCREYFNDARVVVGYNDQKEAQYVYVKWTQKGFHGYPVTLEYLRKKGVNR